jgi:hypothetical protein
MGNYLVNVTYFWLWSNAWILVERPASSLACRSLWCRFSFHGTSR